MPTQHQLASDQKCLTYHDSWISPIPTCRLMVAVAAVSNDQVIGQAYVAVLVSTDGALNMIASINLDSKGSAFRTVLSLRFLEIFFRQLVVGRIFLL